MKEWFSHDPEGHGLEFHETEAEAKAAAEKALDDYRDDAGDGWAESVTGVCWGRLFGQIVETERKPAEEGEPFDETVDYGLKGLGHPALSTKEATEVVEAIHHFSEAGKAAHDRARDKLRVKLARVLNAESVEGRSNTPDFILADFLAGCLDAFERSVVNRAEWHGAKRADG